MCEECKCGFPKNLGEQKLGEEENREEKTGTAERVTWCRAGINDGT